MDGKGLSEKEKIFLALYLCGWSMSESYSIAFDSTATTGLAPMASHLFNSFRIKDVAGLLARYTSANGVQLPKKMQNLY